MGSTNDGGSEKGKEKQTMAGDHNIPTVGWSVRDRSDGSSPRREELPVGKAQEVVGIPMFLRKQSCEALIKEATQFGWAGIGWEYDKDYRDCERVVVKAPLLADILWKNIQADLSLKELHNVRPYGFDNKGFWAPCGVNECIRFSKYEDGGHFEAHKDGTFVVDDDLRSIFTIQIYLNEGFEGGETVFYEERSDGPPEELSITPSTGTLLLFSHDLQHKANPVRGNIPKYILRTDLMYRRISKDPVDERKRLLSNPDFLRMDALYRKSIQLQKEGDPKGSTEAYLEAQKIQTAFPSIPPPEEKEVPTLGWSLSEDASLSVFEYLGKKDLASCCQVSKGWKYLASHPSIWRRLYFRTWPALARVERMVAPAPHLIDYVKPWKECFLNRLEMERSFNVIFFDVGTQTTRFGMTGEREIITRPEGYFHFSHYPPDEPPLDPPEIPSIVAKVRGHYWSSREGLEDYLIGTELKGSHYRCYQPRRPFYRLGTEPHVPAEELQTGYYDRHGVSKLNLPSISEVAGFVIFWDVIRNLLRWIRSAAFEFPQTPEKHPLLVAVPPCFGLHECQKLEFLVTSQLRAPSFAFVSQPVLVLLSMGLKTGLVVSSGHLFTSVTPIREGKPIIEHEVIFPAAGAELEPYLKQQDILQDKVRQLFFARKGREQDPERNLARLAYQAGIACGEETAAELFDHVVLVGGNTFSLETLFWKELQEAAAAAAAGGSGFRPKVEVPEDRLTAVALGAKIFASLSNARDSFSSSLVGLS